MKILEYDQNVLLVLYISTMHNWFLLEKEVWI